MFITFDKGPHPTTFHAATRIFFTFDKKEYYSSPYLYISKEMIEAVPDMQLSETVIMLLMEWVIVWMCDNDHGYEAVRLSKWATKAQMREMLEHYGKWYEV